MDQAPNIGDDSHTRFRKLWNYAPSFSIISYGTILLIFVISVLTVFLGYPHSDLTAPVTPYLIIPFHVFNAGLEMRIGVLLAAVFTIYGVLVSVLARVSIKRKDLRTLRSPVVYFVLVSSASLVVSLFILSLEYGLGIPIGARELETPVEQDPLISYGSLIYAPIVEELGFTILPLGILSAVLVVLRSLNTRTRVYAKEVALSILVPEKARERLGMKVGGIEVSAIIMTSGLFGYAHVYFGSWDWGKFMEAASFGAFAGYSFLKFGAYMDILMHWFRNGVAGAVYLSAGLLAIGGLFLIWSLFVGVVGIILILEAASRRKPVYQSE